MSTQESDLPQQRRVTAASGPGSPYPGLRAFTETESTVFVGREAEAEALWARITEQRLLAVIGPSGAGKSSFVRAGVVAARPPGWAAIVCTPGAAPLRRLGQALTPALAHDAEALPQLVDFDAPGVAVALLRRWRRAHVEALLVLDQFEELFTLTPPAEQARVATLIGRVVAEAGVRVLLVLRDDFLLRCCAQPALAPVVHQLTPLLPLGPEGLRRALVEPAAARGYRFAPATLPDALVAAVADTRAPLPLLAFTAARWWDRRDRQARALTAEGYAAIGGVEGALAQHAEETLARIGPARETLVRELFRNLVTAQGTRAVIGWDELVSVSPDRSAAEAVLCELVDARLLTSYEEPATPGHAATRRVEIVHESLLTMWPRLVRWRTQDEGGAQLRDQLRQAAHLWEEKGRSGDLLWTGTAYREYAVWRERYDAPLTAVEAAYAAAMTERARRTKRIALAVAALGFLVLAGVAAAIAVSRQDAVRSARQAEASQLLAMAQAALASDPTEALAYATASLEISDSRAAREFVVRALQEAPPAREFETASPDSRKPAFSPDGRWLAVAGHSTQVGVWPEDGGPPVRLPGHETSPLGSNVARWVGNDLLVTGLEGGRAPHVQVWGLPTGASTSVIEFSTAARWTIADGRLVAEHATGRTSGRSGLMAWSLPEGRAVDPTTDDRQRLRSDPVPFPPDRGGRWQWRLALNDQMAQVWPRSAPPASRPLRLRRHGSWYASAGAMHPAGTWFAATTTTLSRATLWPLAERAPLVLDGYRSISRPVAFSPDGRWLVTNWEGHALHLWSLPPTSESPGRRLDVPAIQWRAFAADPRGRFVAAVGQPDEAWIVPLDGSPARRLWTPASDCLLHAVALSPSGRLVATAWYFGGGERTLRVVDLETGALRVFPLTPAPHGAGDPVGGYTGSVTSLAFDGESVVYTSGLGGMRQWDLRDGTRQDVGPADTQRHAYAWMTGDRHTAFVTTQNVDGSAPCTAVERLDLASASRSTLPEFGDCPSMWGPHGAGDVLAVGQRDGTIRVGRIGHGQPHILAAHEAAVAEVAVSPDLRWVASSGEDNTLRLWPMPDLSKPPLHTWPLDDLRAKLKSLTNLRAVRDPASSTGWSIALGPFPGWKNVPEW